MGSIAMLIVVLRVSSLTCSRKKTISKINFKKEFCRFNWGMAHGAGARGLGTSYAQRKVSVMPRYNMQYRYCRKRSRRKQVKTKSYCDISKLQQNHTSHHSSGPILLRPGQSALHEACNPFHGDVEQLFLYPVAQQSSHRSRRKQFLPR